MKRILLMTLALAVALLPARKAFAQAKPAPPREVTDEDVDRGIEELKRYIWNQQQTDGHWSLNVWKVPAGGATAINCLAMLEAGESYNNEKLKKGLQALVDFKTEDVYVISVRTMAFSQVVAQFRDSPLRTQLKADVDWLTKNAQQMAAWGYHGPEKLGDNSCSQFALLALYEADRAGMEISPTLIQAVEKTWLARQQKDGGWTYAAQQGVGAPSTATMTTAALASLFICQDTLNKNCTPYASQKVMDNGMDALAKLLDQDFYKNEYLAFCIQRVGMAGGTKFIGKMDWFSVAAGKMCEPDPRGKSYNGDYGPLIRAPMELIFLSRGKTPLTINKLRHNAGEWNTHTRDVPNFTEYMRRNFERRMRWQVVGIDEPTESLLDAPILLIAGTAAADFPPDQWAKLRDYALRGGTLLFVPTHGSKPFQDSVLKNLETLFADQAKTAGGEYKLEQLPAEHTLYKLYGKEVPNGPTAAPLWGVSDGSRLIAIVSGRDICCPWQKRQTKQGEVDYGLGVNLFMYATGGNSMRMRLRPLFNAAGGEAKHTCKVAWLEHGGNWNTQPYALQAVSDKLKAENRVALDIKPGVKIDAQQLQGFHLAWLTGTRKFSLSDSELAALRAHIDNGGTLFVNAVGGSAEFRTAAEEMLDKLFAGKDIEGVTPAADSELVTGKAGDFRGPPLNVLAKTEIWRKQKGGNAIDLKIYRYQNRPAVIYAPYGVHDTLDGHTAHAAFSYMPTSARDIAANVALISLLQTPKAGGGAPVPASGATSKP